VVGYKNGADETGWTSRALFNAIAGAKGIESPKIWEGKKGQKSTAVPEFNMEVRPLLDELIVGAATEFIKRAAGAGDCRVYMAAAGCLTAGLRLSRRVILPRPREQVPVAPPSAPPWRRAFAAGPPGAGR
jgi:hypothetical protein